MHFENNIQILTGLHSSFNHYIHRCRTYRCIQLRSVATMSGEPLSFRTVYRLLIFRNNSYVIDVYCFLQFALLRLWMFSLNLQNLSHRSNDQLDDDFILFIHFINHERVERRSNKNSTPRYKVNSKLIVLGYKNNIDIVTSANYLEIQKYSPHLRNNIH